MQTFAKTPAAPAQPNAVCQDPSADLLLSFDFGRKKTGVAVGNLLTGGARPLGTARGGGEQQFAAIAAYIKEWQPARLVVGLPTHADGREHKTTAAARRFGKKLTAEFNLPVEFVDERLTSIAARDNKAADTDAAAAALILQDWLDAEKRKNKTGEQN